MTGESTPGTDSKPGRNIYIFKSVLLFVLSIVLVNAVLTFVFIPFDELFANGYIKNGYFYTAAGYFFRTFFQYGVLSVIIVAGLFVLGLAAGIARKPARKNIFAYGFFNNKFYLSLCLIAVLFVVAAGSFIWFKAPPKGPNVIFIAVDTLRADYTSLHDEKIGTTPRLKEFAANDAVFFPNTYANSPWTLPSFASMITAQYPSRLNIHNRDSSLHPHFFTMAEILKEHGYVTGGMVSNMFLRKKHGFDQGFDVFSEKNVSHYTEPLYGISSPGITEEGIEFIRNNKDKKFFLFLHYFDPHYYYYDHEKTSGYSGMFKKAASKNDQSELVMNINMGKQTFEQEDIDFLKYCYNGEIRFTDKYIGQILDELKKHGLYENSIIIFTADHGEEFAERGTLGHGHTLYEEQIKVPMAIKLPAGQTMPGGKVNRKTVSNIDLLPTLMTLLDIENNIKNQGGNLFTKGDGKDPILSEVNQVLYRKKRDKISVILDGWKLILDLKTKKYELYGLAQDPGEKDNKIDNNENAPSKIFIKKMKKELMLFLAMRKKYSSGTPGKHVKMTEEEKRRLKSLGYF